MPLSPNEKTILLNEINNDPLSLGYANKTAAQIADIMNTPGSASYNPPQMIVSDLPIYVKGKIIIETVADIDGLIDRNNSFGAGAVELLRWFDTLDSMAVVCRYMCAPSADFNIASPSERNMVNEWAGIEVQLGSPPVTFTLISETAMTAILAMGLVEVSRAQELISRRVSEANILEALAP